MSLKCDMVTSGHEMDDLVISGGILVGPYVCVCVWYNPTGKRVADSAVGGAEVPGVVRGRPQGHPRHPARSHHIVHVSVLVRRPGSMARFSLLFKGRGVGSGMMYTTLTNCPENDVCGHYSETQSSDDPFVEAWVGCFVFHLLISIVRVVCSVLCDGMARRDQTQM
jgi:hypothetical protein